MANLPANPLADFAARAAQKRQPVQRTEGGFLTFNGKSGGWSFGQDETPVQGKQVLILSDSMQHGFIQWGNKPCTKVFSSVAQDLPRQPVDVDGVDDDGRPKVFVAQPARQMVGKFMDAALGQFIFNTSSMGGVERTDELFDDILDKSLESEYCYPVVELESDFYKRATGRVYKPVFKIVGWRNVDGAEEGVARLAKPAKPAPAPEPEFEEVEDDAPAPVTQRRRRTVS